MKFNLKRNVFETTHCSVASKRKTQNSILQIPICLMHNIKFKITSVEIQFVLQEPISLFQNRHNQQFCSQMTWRFRNMKEKKISYRWMTVIENICFLFRFRSIINGNCLYKYLCCWSQNENITAENAKISVFYLHKYYYCLKAI